MKIVVAVQICCIFGLITIAIYWRWSDFDAIFIVNVSAAFDRQLPDDAFKFFYRIVVQNFGVSFFFYFCFAVVCVETIFKTPPHLNGHIIWVYAFNNFLKFWFAQTVEFNHLVQIINRFRFASIIVGWWKNFIDEIKKWIFTFKFEFTAWNNWMDCWMWKCLQFVCVNSIFSEI